MFQVNEPQKPLFSVIIPLYNKAPYIKRAIDSVLAQTIHDFEIIVVNDGSTDGGENIVAEYSDSRIFLINQKNSGVSVARNNGVNVANSDYIAFLDADDEWLPGFLNEIQNMINQYPYAGLYSTAVELVYGDRIERENHLIPTYKNVIEYNTNPIELNEYFRTCVLMGYSPITSSSHVVTKDALKSVGYYNPTSHLSEDLEVWGKLAYTSVPIIYSFSIQSRIHVIAENKATDRFFVQTHSPFVNYILSLSIETNADYSNNIWISKYISSLEILAAFNNIGAGNFNGAKTNLKYVSGDEYRIQKIILHLFCNLPFNIGKYGPICYNKLKKNKFFETIMSKLKIIN